MFNIEQDSQEFNDGQGWVSIVELELDLVWPFVPESLLFNHESSDTIADGGGDQQVLLLESQFFSGVAGVVGIEH